MSNHHICISVATRNRPKMLGELFSSFVQLTEPENVRISFLVVENNPLCTLGTSIEGFRTSIPDKDIEYLLETNISIAAARNRSLEHAIEKNFDLLVYVDDDEVVEPDWLACLLRERDRLDLDITGSPVRPKPFDTNLNFWQRIVWSGIERHAYKSEEKCRRRCAQGQGGSIKLATGSWMGRLDFFRKTGLRFDSRLGLTGGEDWNLWAQAKAQGAKTGWACDAIVYEIVPPARLSLAYHFRRNRDHNITEFGARYRENPKRALRQLPAKILGRLLKFIIALCSTPFKGGCALISSAMALGGAVGLIQACFGKSSRHYANTTGF